MAKIMHISDLHLDSPLTGLDSEKREIRRYELKKSFENAIDYAAKNGARIVLLSGDVFDGRFVKDETIEFIKRIFSKNSEINFFISPGNHDPYTLPVYEKISENLSGNVKIFKDAFESVYLPDLNVRIYGRGFKNETEPESLMEGFKVCDEDTASIVVIHGEVTGNESIYNPIKISDIENCGADYVALGHTHTYSGILKAKNTYYAYSGTHEGHGFDECDKKGFIFGDVEKGKVQLKFIPFCIREYKTVEMDISDCEMSEDVIKKAESIVSENGEGNLYKFILTGKRPDTLLPPSVIAQKCENAFFAKVYDETHIRADFNELAKGKDLKGICIKNILDDMTDENSEEYQKLLEFAAEIFG